MYLKRLASVQKPVAHVKPSSAEHVDDDNLAIGLFAKIAEQMMVQEVAAAWSTLSDYQKARLPSMEMSRVRKLPTRTLDEVAIWRNEYLKVIRSVTSVSSSSGNTK